MCKGGDRAKLTIDECPRVLIGRSDDTKKRDALLEVGDACEPHVQCALYVLLCASLCLRERLRIMDRRVLIEVSDRARLRGTLLEVISASAFRVPCCL